MNLAVCIDLTETYFLKDFIYVFLEKEWEGERERERNIDVWEKYQSVASRTHTGLWLRPFGLWDNAQPTEPY